MIKFNLRHHMDSKDITTADLVEKTKKLDPNNKGVHRNTISKLLNGNSNGIQFETLDLLCNALKLESSAELIEFVKDE
ncbi:DNA-binding Xre family transcriptional regulator [Virgibacillus halotolerans]|uniref:helix-turn-helix domain-containing protein n=1 Tax=Virgibacillus halotolerans TaxID=1071053 RepID=UPI001961E91F|nr:helix-turn-helix transcriptional regulator [Virgibacillus halotolerans]MBM7598500.1 DNA-binding Xre family transcriptional regulator [Virgibacillus halotolerans]